jgi:hypothetical protein
MGGDQVLRNQQSVQVGTVSTQLLGPNPNRIGLVFGTPQTNRVTVSLTGDAVLDRGLPLFPGTAWQTLMDEKMVGAFTEPVSAIAAVAAEWITVVELIK